MLKLLLYLFESALALSMLYLVYWFFLRKETFFTFNRTYLLAIMLFSILVPLMNVTFWVATTDNLEKPFSEIGKFRNFYTDLLSMTDSEYAGQKYRSYQAAVFENPYPDSHAQINRKIAEAGSFNSESITNSSKTNNLNILRLILSIYFLGILIFFFRFVYLMFWLIRTLRNHPVIDKGNYRLVLLEKELPPFSFFRYIFVNKEATMFNEFEQVLTHEQVHVSQRHSFDLLIAHGISVFQWFNPLVWQLQKAIKTTHEYIADGKVVNQGFELFDYQSLLLSQLIGIRSVALVNNFNLVSIKKRITMMTKNKSGFTAKLKVLFIIPMAIVTFFLFAHMTVKSPALSFTNFKPGKTSHLDGIWQNTNPQSYGSLLYFHGNSLSILENTQSVNVVDLSFDISGKALILKNYGPTSESIRYELSGNQLKVWWNSNKWSEYQKTPFENSAQVFMPQKFESIQLPRLSETKMLEKQPYVYTIYVAKDRFYVDDVPCTAKKSGTNAGK